MIFRYFRLYKQFLLFSMSKTAQFRMDFLLRIVMDCIYYATNIFFFKILFMHSGSLAGWTEEQVMIFVGIFLVIDGINMTLFSNNLFWLPYLVNNGALDYYLLRPVSSLFFISTREVAINSFINLVFALSILSWALYQYPQPITWDRYIIMAITLAVGMLLYYFMRILLILPVFWTQSGKGGDMVFWTLSRLIERPERIFKSWMRIALITVIPFGIIASFPAHTLWEANPWYYLGLAILVTSIFAMITLSLWRLALRSYTSASS